LYTLLMVVIQGAISSALDAVVPLAGTCAAAVVAIPLQAGLVYVCLKQLKGERWEFSTFFKTIQQPYLGPLLGSQLLVLLIGVVGIIPPVVLFIVGLAADIPECMIAAGVLLVIALLVSSYFEVRLGLFSVHLILDRGYGAIDALKGTWELTRGHVLPL